MLRIIRHHPRMMRKRNGSAKRKTYPDQTPNTAVCGISISSYATFYQNIDFTSIIEDFALNDNRSYKHVTD